MPRVPFNPIPTQSPAPTATPRSPSDYQQIGASPSDFGAQVGLAEEQGAREAGAATQQLGGTLSNIGNALAARTLALQDQQNTRTALDINSDLTQQIGQLTAKYQSTSGQQAVDGYQDYHDQVSQLRQQALDNAPNPAVRDMVLRSADALTNSALTSGATHSYREGKVATVNALNANTIIQAQHAVQFRDHPDMVDQSIATAQQNGEQAAISSGAIPGSDEAKLAGEKAAGTVVLATVQGLIQDRDAGAAEAVINKYQDSIDPESLLKSRALIKPQADADSAYSYVQGMIHPGSQKGSDNNPGNLRTTGTAWDQKTTPAGAPYEQFATPEAGSKAWFTNVQTQVAKAGGKMTYIQLLNLLTPASDNNPADYGQKVLADAHLDPNAQVDVNDKEAMISLLASVNKFEKAQRHTISPTAISSGWDSFHNGTPLPAPPKQEEAPQPLPSYGDGLSHIENDPTLSPSEKAERIRIYGQMYNDQQRAINDQKTAVDKQVQYAAQSLLSGNMDTPIPTADIIRTHTKEQADAILAELDSDKIAGSYLSGLKWADPSQIAATTQILSRTTDDNGAPIPADQYAKNQAALKIVQDEMAKRAKLLQDDPAAYVQSNPQVAAAYSAFQEATDPNDKQQKFQEYQQQVIATQQQLGLSGSQIHVMSKATAENLASKIAAGQADGTAARAAQEITKNYGQRGWNDIVTLGGLPPSAQILPTITSAYGRSEFQNYLKDQRQTGGYDKYVGKMSSSVRKDLDSKVTNAMVDFSKSVLGGPADNTGVNGAMKQAMTGLSVYFMNSAGMDAEHAVALSKQLLIDSKWDFMSTGPTGGLPLIGAGLGSVRVPKGRAGDVDAYGDRTLAALKPGDMDSNQAAALTLTPEQQKRLAATRGEKGLTPEEQRLVSPERRQEILLQAAKSGMWINTPDGTGMMRVAHLMTGGWVPVRLKNGQPIIVKFKDVPYLGASSAAPAATPAATPGEPPNVAGSSTAATPAGVPAAGIAISP